MNCHDVYGNYLLNHLNVMQEWQEYLLTIRKERYIVRRDS
mgnify:FL=1